MNEHEAISLAEQHYSVKFARVTNGEYRSLTGCPWCGDGGKGDRSDRFRLILNGQSGPRVWCRQCGKYEFLDKLDETRAIDFRLAALERRQEAVERKQKEQEERLRLLELMNKSRDHITYYNNMAENLLAVQYWMGEGMSPETINKRLLGYCPECPTARFSPSYTIPVLYRAVPYNIRHRLVNPNGSGKYRPHISGLPSMIFNADDLGRNEDHILILEGEKKSMIVTQETGLPNVAIMGMQSFNKSWVPKFDRFKKIYVALDPDADERAAEIAKLFNGRGMLVTLPLKADDFFVRAKGTRKEFLDYINWARSI